MRKARGALCAAAAKLKDPRARARSPRRKVFISSLHERPPADVEILAHGHVHEAARAGWGARAGPRPEAGAAARDARPPPPRRGARRPPRSGVALATQSWRPPTPAATPRHWT